MYDWMHDAVLRDGALAERVDVTHMSSGVLAVLGVPPLLGRTLRPEDDHPGSRVAVLSHEFWMRRWNGDPRVLGKDVLIDDGSYRVVGIMPEGFRFYHDPGTDQRTWSDLYLSDPWAFTSRSARWAWSLGAIGRLKDGVTLRQAGTEVATLAATTDYGVPPSADWGTPKFGGRVTPWLVTQQDVSFRLLLVWGVSSVVLLLAATNTASLLMARAGARRRELAVRTAIGASRQRLVRQLLTESVLLALMGGIAGLTIAVWAVPVIETCIPDRTPMWRLHEAGLNWRVLGFMMAVALLTGVGFGVAPALSGSGANQRPVLLASGRLTDTKAATRMRGGLLVAQLAVSLVLLAGAGLMVTTLSRLWSRPLGFDADNLITFVVRLPVGTPFVTDLGLRPMRPTNPSGNSTLFRRWAPTTRLLSVPEQLAERLRAIPGVSAATVTVATGIPMFGAFERPFELPGRPTPTEAQRQAMSAVTVRALPGYFATLGMQVLAGRGFSVRDQWGAPVAIINRHMARTYWSHEAQALGDQVIIGLDRQPHEIVGIVNDVRFSMWDGESASKIYAPLRAEAAAEYTRFEAEVAVRQSVAVRVTPGHEVPVDAMRRAVAEVTDGAPIDGVRSMAIARMEASGNTPGLTLLLSSAATIALLLAAIGIFGMVSYTVSLRTREIGIRMALGASRGAILRLVLAGAAWLGLAGIALGLAASFWLTRLLAGELFPDTSATNPQILAGGACVLGAVLLAATWLPARRASRVDPQIALRQE